ncbi:MAG: tripartite tricarboxylate transporter substrate binding protein [Thalassobaculales bacterium]
MIRTLAAAAAAVSLAAFGAAPALAAWPEKPIKVVVPFGPGGTTDVLARNLQRVIQEQNLSPQPVTILNVGGHFSVGSTQVKNTAPDGHNFLVIHLALLTGEIVDPARKLSYRDFDPVALTGGFCLHPVVMDNSPFKTLKDMMEEAKAKPSTLIFGVNIGALNHMAGVFMEKTYPGAKFRFVQIGGGAENFAALKGGQTQVGVLSSSEYQNFKGAGVRALGYTGPQRLELEPNIATMREQGLDFDFCINNYWFAPKGTAKEAIDGMANLLEKAMALPAMREIMKKQASSSDFLKGPAFAKSLDDTFAAVRPVAEAARPQK